LFPVISTTSVEGLGFTQLLAIYGTFVRCKDVRKVKLKLTITSMTDGSEASVDIYKTTLCSIPECISLDTRYQNLRFTLSSSNTEINTL
jgi:hypothetical protein